MRSVLEVMLVVVKFTLEMALIVEDVAFRPVVVILVVSILLLFRLLVVIDVDKREVTVPVVELNERTSAEPVTTSPFAVIAVLFKLVVIKLLVVMFVDLMFVEIILEIVLVPRD